MAAATTGDIVVVDFPGVHGRKRRPSIVVSSAEYHRERPDVILGLITSQLPAKPAVTDYILRDWQSAGLQKPSAFRSYFATLPKSAVTAVIGRAATADWQAIVACVRASFVQ